MKRARTEQGSVVNTVDGDISDSTVLQSRDMTLKHSSSGRDHNDFHHFNGTFINEQHNHLPRHQVDWPVRVGNVPEEAAHYQHRGIADQLDQALRSFGTVAPRQVLSGAGGVGKTQLAAHHTRTRMTDPDQRVDILVWADASTREQVTYAYAQAAQHLFTTAPDDPEDAARLLLVWLGDPHKHQNRRWLIVWDDLTDPAALHDLWPPHDQPHGRVLVTTRRRDHSLTVQGRHLLEVDVYTPHEARAFLTEALDAAGRIAHTTRQLDALAHDLAYLPLALGQAVTYMAELGLSCDDYLQVFHDRMNALGQVFPDWELPTPLAATWELSLTQADTFQPRGTARPLMGLIALLEGTGIPERLLTTSPVLEYLTDHRTGTAATAATLTPHQARTALANLVRLNLITRTTPPTTADGDAPGQVSVGAHHLVQRATREHTATRPTPRGIHTLADALAQVWPEVERDTALAQHLRSNTAILRSHQVVEGRTSEDWLWEPDGHTLLFRAGRSLGEAGRVGEAVAYWQYMTETAQRRLGPDHPDTLITRAGLANWRGETGDLSGAISAYEDLLTDNLRVLGPDHPDTLTTRGRLAAWRGETGDLAAAVTAYEDLLTDRLRVLGPDHPHTFTTRHNLAWQTYTSGDAARAVELLTALVHDEIRVLGPGHPDTQHSEQVLQRWRNELPER